VLVCAQAAAQDLVRAIGEDLVHVHVKADTRAGMEYIDNELIHVLSGEDFVACRDDRILPALVETPGLGVRERGCPLDPHEASDERRERAIAADGIVLDRSLGLRAPQSGGGDLDLAQRVTLTTRAHRERTIDVPKCRRTG